MIIGIPKCSYSYSYSMCKNNPFVHVLSGELSHYYLRSGELSLCFGGINFGGTEV